MKIFYAILPVFAFLMVFSTCSRQEDLSSSFVVDHIPFPQHPFLAPNGKSNMHDDSYMSDTYKISGPENHNPLVTLRRFSKTLNTCVTLTFDSRGRILTTEVSMLASSILLLDPKTMDVIATYPLPKRDLTDPLFPYNDTSGATYFVLDNRDRVLLADASNAIRIIKYNDETRKFDLLKRYDLSNIVVPMKAPAKDHVQMTIPGWHGRYLWFTSRYGVVGTVNEKSGEIRHITLNHEEIENSFAVAEDGVYIITDHAMYRFVADDNGTPKTVWRTPYDRGDRVKPSNFNQGSGTTPQIFGKMVAIADNAEPRMNILFLKRSDGSVVCKQPVFDAGKSTTENALPGLVRNGPNGLEYSVIIDNNYGIQREKILAKGRCWANHAGNLIRLDLLPDKHGKYHCKQIWRSPEKSSQVLPKLSLKNGLLYIYTYKFLQDKQDYTWYLTALDFFTGKTVFRIPTGEGLDYTNFGQPLILGPDGHTAYLGTMGGLLRIQDSDVTP